MELVTNWSRWFVPRACVAAAIVCAGWWAAAAASGQELEASEEFYDVQQSLGVSEPLFPDEGSVLQEEVLPPADGEPSFLDGDDVPEPLDSFGGVDPLARPHEHLRPFDYMRHWGFHHSSTEGRFTDKNVPLNFSSWLNRPFHIDWFAGPLLSDSPNKTMHVKQTNALFGGLRFGWDFDYYWGTEWRFAWSDPEIFYEGSSDRQPGQYWASDVNILYYPWGDTRVRPFFVTGVGISQIGSLHNDGGGLEANLLGTPFGLGIQFQQTPWLVWRAEIMDNLAWGSEGISTTHNVSFTAGMNIRYGARKPSYWPWRTSRSTW
ncbi:hypothetical protein [Lacipirellula parvula]|uniref:Outer membrane protein beta-barrel domain-containing protein n=1 Tax=Lacipirellula parvula TaxID=2650471 RepID=A0A5K7X3N8_9BACT|nr:hypothetical protein [Lacipirellula parvula]BBO31274.1 hypothetical protein PLANPX_0886 [Lacipirellula parvula]